MCHNWILRKMCHSSEMADPRSERTRARAMAAAQELLLSEGMGAVTHVRLAAALGGGRRTLYRHWPDADALLRDVLAMRHIARGTRSGDLQADLLSHLLALRDALNNGPLSYVISALNERAHNDTTFDAVRVDLSAAGCEPLHTLLTTAIERGALPDTLNLELAQAELEGPLFFYVLVRNKPIPRGAVTSIVASFLMRVQVG
jgi:AcrR family transcriptional regulator